MPDANQMAKLVIDSQAGDVNSFNELYNLSAQDLKVVGYSILHKKEDVEDALQETYITIYRSFTGQGRSPLDKPESFLPWAKKIMKNTCLNQIALRKRKAGKDELRPMTTEDDQAGMDQIDNFDDDVDFSPEDAAETQYVRELLGEAMSDIPAVRQTCLALHQQGMKYKEISAKLDLPEGTVKSHVRYAKSQLQKAIRKIEEKENVKLNGVVLLPAAMGVQVICRVQPKQGWISAQVKDAAGGETAKGGSKVKKGTLSTSGRQAVAAAMLAAIVAIVSIILALVPQHMTNSTQVPVTEKAQHAQQVLPEKSNQQNLGDKTVKRTTDTGWQEFSAVENQSRSGRNEFYDPDLQIEGTGVQIVPYHVWYSGGKMYADCYIINLTDSTVSEIEPERIQIATPGGIMIGDAGFGEIPNLTLAPGQNVSYRFVYQKGTFTETDLTKGIQCQSSAVFATDRANSSQENKTKHLSAKDAKSVGTAQNKSKAEAAPEPTEPETTEVSPEEVPAA